MPDTGGRFPLPYPVPADPLGDGAAAMQALAEAQHYANGLLIGASLPLASNSGVVTVPYGVTFSDVPTVFVTHQTVTPGGGSTGGAFISQLWVNEVYEDQCEIAAIDTSGSSYSIGVVVWVIPPPA